MPPQLPGKTASFWKKDTDYVISFTDNTNVTTAAKPATVIITPKAVDEPIMAVIHIQKTAPAPPTDMAPTLTFFLFLPLSSSKKRWEI